MSSITVVFLVMFVSSMVWPEPDFTVAQMVMMFVAVLAACVADMKTLLD